MYQSTGEALPNHDVPRLPQGNHHPRPYRCPPRVTRGLIPFFFSAGNRVERSLERCDGAVYVVEFVETKQPQTERGEVVGLIAS